MRTRVKVKVLKGLLRERITIADAAIKENQKLKKRVDELEESCENFSEVELNLHKEIAELKQKKPSGIKKRIANFFS